MDIAGIGIALGIALVGALVVMREASRQPDHHEDAITARAAPRSVDPPREQVAAPPEMGPRASADILPSPKADPLPQAERPQPPAKSEPFFAPPEHDRANGLVITPFIPAQRPRAPARRPVQVAPVIPAAELIPGARVEIVDVTSDVLPGGSALRPDPNRFIQTEAAVRVSVGMRLLAVSRLVVGVTCLGVIFGVAIILGVRGLVEFFKAAF